MVRRKTQAIPLSDELDGVAGLVKRTWGGAERMERYKQSRRGCPER